MRIKYVAKFKQASGTQEVIGISQEDHPVHVWTQIRNRVASRTGRVYSNPELKDLGWRVDRVFVAEADDLDLVVQVAKKAGFGKVLGRLFKSIF